MTCFQGSHVAGLGNLKDVLTSVGDQNYCLISENKEISEIESDNSLLRGILPIFTTSCLANPVHFI